MPETSVGDNREASSTGPEGPAPAGPKGTRTTSADRETPYKPKYTPLWTNLITMTGIFLVTIGILSLLTFGLLHVVTPVTNPYVDIVGYLLVPGILILGLAIIPLGILLKSWRLHRRDPAQRLAVRFPRIDLNDPQQRRAAKFVIGGTFVLLPVVAVSGYHGYHYTDSAEFCAKACHAVMAPQATTYGNSPHARVACAECHIGAGASWFVKSKLSGTRQVLAMWQDSFPRPIPPAITNLRPAQETCEQCHWPKKFFGAQLKEIVRYASDERNARRKIDMLLKTGGGDESTGRAEGIHMHMALSGRIEYIATDDKLQEIPWVKWTDAAGNELIYRSDGRPSSDPKPQGRVRQLDCMDCHNRPAHKFRSPQDAVDIFLDVGKIDTTLPFVKREAVAVLVRPYPDVATAEAQIGISLTEFYRTRYPEVWETRRASINQAIDSVRGIYRHAFFPSMNVDWRTYPDNIGHKISPGCFRCHEGRHVNQRGERISHECHVCHSFLNPMEHGGDVTIIHKGDFVHPLKLEGRHAELRCDRCHSGGVAPDATCSGCHDRQQGLYGATLEELAPFDVEPSPMFDSVECQACHDLAQPLSIETVNATCVDCHEGDEGDYDGMLATWVAELAAARKSAAQSMDKLEPMAADGDQVAADPDLRVWIDRSRAVLALLAEAGDVHNPEAAHKVYATVARQARERLAALETDAAPSSAPHE